MNGIQLLMILLVLSLVLLASLCSQWSNKILQNFFLPEMTKSGTKSLLASTREEKHIDELSSNKHIQSEWKMEFYLA